VKVPVKQTRRFFLTGPLRTGTSLLTRCIDDHPQAICLCESEVNRALFEDYYLRLHYRRMEAHGIAPADSTDLLDRKRQDDFASLEVWYLEAGAKLSKLYEKPDLRSLGDKSPDLFRCRRLVRHMAETFPLVYTVRDPRAIFRSIDSQQDATPPDKAERWDSLIQNYLAWKPYLDNENVLILRYEDLVSNPEEGMQKVYAHIGLPNSTRFTETFKRPFPRRFLWPTAIDWETGIHKETDPSRISSWQSSLTDTQLARIQATPYIDEFMDRFQYKA
jgi:hypothetical protein